MNDHFPFFLFHLQITEENIQINSFTVEISNECRFDHLNGQMAIEIAIVMRRNQFLATKLIS